MHVLTAGQNIIFVSAVEAMGMTMSGDDNEFVETSRANTVRPSPEAVFLKTDITDASRSSHKSLLDDESLKLLL